MNSIKAAVFCTVLLMACTAYAEQQHDFPPAAGYVPDEATAVRIAEAVWIPIYGDRVLEKKPFHAKLQGESWIVEGSLPEGMLGGVPLAEVSKLDGRVLRVSHGK